MLFGASKCCSLEPTRFARQSLEAMPTLAALKASPWAGATREPAWAGPGATRGVATALEAAPEHASGGIRGGRLPVARPKHAQRPYSGRLARGITCPLPGVNRDPPALAPAGTFRPGGRPEEPRRSGANQSDDLIHNPFARGAAPPGRHLTQRRRSASSARPHWRRATDLCARSRGGAERAW
jgi:hypothetical protein